MKKKFICSNFSTISTCAFEVTGDESYVIKTATNHVIEEHGYQDSPAIQQQIADSLIDVP